MKVSVLFFGATADVVGKREIEISFTEGDRASAIFNQILEDHLKLKAHKLLFSVNQEFSDGNELLKNGDELAIFTAVSGG